MLHAGRCVAQHRLLGGGGAAAQGDGGLVDAGKGSAAVGVGHGDHVPGGLPAVDNLMVHALHLEVVGRQALGHGGGVGEGDQGGLGHRHHIGDLVLSHRHPDVPGGVDVLAPGEGAGAAGDLGVVGPLLQDGKALGGEAVGGLGELDHVSLHRGPLKELDLLGARDVLVLKHRDLGDLGDVVHRIPPEHPGFGDVGACSVPQGLYPEHAVLVYLGYGAHGKEHLGQVAPAGGDGEPAVELDAGELGLDEIGDVANLRHHLSHRLAGVDAAHVVGLIQKGESVVGRDLVGVHPRPGHALHVVGAPEPVPVVVEELAVAVELRQGRPCAGVGEVELHRKGADLQGVAGQGEGPEGLPVHDLVVGKGEAGVFDAVKAHVGLLWGFLALKVTVSPVQRVTPATLSRCLSSPAETMAW